MKLKEDFYTRPDVEQVSKDLLGKVLCTRINGILTSGKIVETEAYCGATDRACHAYQHRRTKRTEVMFQKGGVAYVYLCYGIHHLFNVVTNCKDLADAVLIRAVEPLEGEEEMLQRRNMKKLAYRLTAGPGSVSQALGILTRHKGTRLDGELIWLEDRNIQVQEKDILSGARIGVAYAEEDALLPWRFRIKDNPWCSKPQ